jgi:hypothetical protein
MARDPQPARRILIPFVLPFGFFDIFAKPLLYPLREIAKRRSHGTLLLQIVPQMIEAAPQESLLFVRLVVTAWAGNSSAVVCLVKEVFGASCYKKHRQQANY